MKKIIYPYKVIDTIDGGTFGLNYLVEDKEENNKLQLIKTY